jgi:hypothetical protein
VGKRSWLVTDEAVLWVLGLVTAGLSPCSHDLVQSPTSSAGGREAGTFAASFVDSPFFVGNADFAERTRGGGRGHVLPCVQTVESGGLPPLPAAKTADADTCLPQRAGDWRVRYSLNFSAFSGSATRSF